MNHSKLILLVTVILFSTTPVFSQTKDISGTWYMVCCNGKHRGEIQIVQTRGAITGRFRDLSGNDTGSLTGIIEGNRVSFTRVFDGRKRQTYSLILSSDGQSMKGALEGDRDRSVGVDVTCIRKHGANNPGPNPPSKNTLLAKAIEAFQATATNFGEKFLSMGNTRSRYLKAIKDMSNEILDMVRNNRISAEEGAQQAHNARNLILEMSRGKDSELGRAWAESLKKTGKSFEEVLEKSAKKLFRGSFSSLSQSEKNMVYLDTIKSAGRPQERVTNLVGKLGAFGKLFIAASIAIAYYDIATSNDKVSTAGKQGAGLAGGIGGGVLGGAAAGLICGPGAPVCSAIGVFVGGVIGAVTATEGYSWLTAK